MSRSKADWSRQLAKPIEVGRGRRKLRTFECVRAPTTSDRAMFDEREVEKMRRAGQK